MHFCKANQNVRKRQNAVFFALQKTKAVRCKNAFDAKMHFCNASNAFDAKMLCFLLCKKQRCVHFVLRCKNAFDAKMHLMRTFCYTKCYKCIFAYIFQRKMFSCAKMHLMQKCIFATHHIFQRKMFSVHFPLENVQLCKNAFDAKMHFGVHFPLENVQLCKNAVFFALQKTKMLCKNAFCKNAFLQHFVLQKCIFASTKCYKCI